MDLVAGAVEEPGVDKDHAVRGGLHAGLEVQRGAPLLIHDADLEGALRQAEHVLDAAEQLAGEGDLLRAVHLGFDDVDRAGAAVLPVTAVQRDQAGEQCVLYAFEDFAALGLALAEDDRVVGHQVTDVADEQQAAAGQGDGLPVGSGVGAVVVEHPGESGAALGDLLGEVALVQAQPIAVAHDLVRRVHGGHRILEIHDGGDRGFEHDILDAGRVGRPDRRIAVDEDLDVQSVMDQQHRFRCRGVPRVAGELTGIGQPDHAGVAQFDL